MLVGAVGNPAVKFDKLRVLAFSVGVAVGIGGCAAAPTPSPRVVVVHKSPSSSEPSVELPRVSEGNTDEEVGEGLTAEQVAAVVETRSLAVGGCHVVEYSGRAPVAGFVVVDLDIERNGAVANAAVVDSSFEH